MVTKKELIKEFQKNFQIYWKVKLFDDLGFKRKQCNNCGKFFWTLDADRKTCPDPPCQNYEFIGNPITKKKWNYIETWEEIEKFFIKRGHTKIQRYPIVCRWRPDLFFNNASIVDFQRLQNGKITFEYPANPLIVLQPCLRFRDIENVGVSGRHHTCFNMPGQHAFNPPKEGYWKDRCIELNFKFWTKIAKVAPEELVYTEDLWAMPDFSVFGTSLELFSRGLELVTNVFMEFRKSNSGFEEAPVKVIDVGWGHERVCWFTNGTPTIYDTAFGPVIEKLKKAVDVKYDKEFFLKYSKLSGSLNLDEIPDIKIARQEIAKKLKVSVEELNKKITPLEGLYAIADHTRALVFAISDGALPSNVGGGYNLRVILRRALSFIDKFEWDLKLQDVALWHVDYLKRIFPELTEHKEEIVKILEVEGKRYRQTKERSRKIVESLAGRKLTQEDLMMIHESEGITPEQLGVEVPANFYAKVTEKHMGEKIEELPRISLDVIGIPSTKILYYDPVYKFKAKVLKVSGNYVILDQSAFYPRSGGQECDTGNIGDCKVVNVEKLGSVIIHQLESCSLKEGQTAECEIDKNRRIILTKHHVATHIINGAARKTLGSHVWQHSAFKDVDKARLDITHYESLTEEQVENIEKLANEIVEKDLPIKVEILPRNKAEEKYGFTIYQGGAIPEKILRIVSIGNIDTEACSGTHYLLKSTKDVGYILILKTKRIQDGIDRIEFVAGDVALQNLKEKERILEEVAEKLKVEESKVPEVVKELFEKWKKLRKKVRNI